MKVPYQIHCQCGHVSYGVGKPGEFVNSDCKHIVAILPSEFIGCHDRWEPFKFALKFTGIIVIAFCLIWIVVHGHITVASPPLAP